MDSMAEAFFIVHGLGGVLLALLASKWKGRGAGIWFIIGFLQPIIGLCILACMPKIEKEADNARAA